MANDSISMSVPADVNGVDMGSQPRQLRHVIQYNEHLLVRLPSGHVKDCPLLPNTSVVSRFCSLVDEYSTITLGKFGSFKSDNLVGLVYDQTYEVGPEGTVTAMPPELVSTLQEENDDTRDNRMLLDNNEDHQSFTNEEIELHRKTQEDSGRGLIAKVIGGNKTFHEKTEFSQKKYRERKEQKFLQFFTPLMSTTEVVRSFLFDKGPQRVQYLSEETLSYMLSLGNVYAGGRYLVVEDLGGLLISACLESMGNDGTVFSIHDNELPNFNTLKYFPHQNQTELEAAGVLRSLDFARAFAPSDESAVTPQIPSSERDAPRVQRKNEKEKRSKLTIEEFLKGDFDALLISSSYNACDLATFLLPYCKTGAPMVIHSPWREVLLDVQRWMLNPPISQNADIGNQSRLSLNLSQDPEFLNNLKILSPTITEIHTRRWVTADMRSRPYMQDNEGLGGLCSGIYVRKVPQDPEEKKKMLVDVRRRKRKSGR